MFALADCNNFFASCERVFRPDLQGKPVIVLSNNDGCAVARSNEAKALGIKMGDPYFKIKHIVEKHGVAVFSAHGYDQIVGDGENLCLYAIAGQNPGDTFLHPEGLRTTHSKLIAKIRCQIQKF